MKSFKEYIEEGKLKQKLLKKIKMRPFDRKERKRKKEIHKKNVAYNKMMGIQAAYDIELEEDIKSIYKSAKGFFKDTRKKIDMKGWKSKVHHGKHPEAPQANDNAIILLAIDPKTGKEHHIASGNLSKQDIQKFKKMYGLK